MDTPPAALKKPRITITKGVRLTPEELAHVGKLLAHYPECASEAELLRQATLIGVYVLAAQATGQPAYAGYQPSDLVDLLKYRVLPAIDFLFEHDAYPALYRFRTTASGAAELSSSTADDAASMHSAAEAAGELSDLGTDFME
jgi:hypothetical protein